MLSIVLLSLAIPVGSPGLPALAATVQDDPTVQIWLSKREGIGAGDQVRVYVRSEQDGHLVVLHADPQGRVRVLFPIDPLEDDFIRAGRDYEVTVRGDRPAIQADENGGIGLVFAAYSRDPFAYTDFTREDHWDYRILGDVDVEGNAEDELIEIVQGMARGAYFAYDLADYYVATPVAYGGGRYRGYGDSYYRSGCRSYSGLHVGFGYGYGYGYRPYYSPFGFSLGWRSYPSYGSCYDPFYYGASYYDPFYYDPFYYGFGFGRRHGFGFGHGHGFGFGHGRPIVVVAGGQRFASVNRRYTFKTTNRTATSPYRKRFTSSPAVVASNRPRLRPEARRSGVTSSRRTFSPSQNAARTSAGRTSAGRRAAPTRGTSARQPTAGRTTQAAPSRRTPTATQAGRTARRPTASSPSNGGARSAPARRTPTAGQAGQATRGARSAPARTPAPAERAASSARRNPSNGLTPAAASSARRSPSNSAQRSGSAASRRATPAARRSETRSASSTAGRRTARANNRLQPAARRSSRSSATRSGSATSRSARPSASSRSSAPRLQRRARPSRNSASARARTPSRSSARSAPRRSTRSAPRASRPSSNRSARPAPSRSSGSSARVSRSSGGRRSPARSSRGSSRRKP